MFDDFRILACCISWTACHDQMTQQVLFVFVLLLTVLENVFTSWFQYNVLNMSRTQSENIYQFLLFPFLKVKKIYFYTCMKLTLSP